MVGRQPFGEFGMSGVGSKAGRPDYLLQFMNPKSISENTIKKGFYAGTAFVEYIIYSSLCLVAASKTEGSKLKFII